MVQDVVHPQYLFTNQHGTLLLDGPGSFRSIAGRVGNAFHIRNAAKMPRRRILRGQLEVKS